MCVQGPERCFIMADATPTITDLILSKQRQDALDKAALKRRNKMAWLLVSGQCKPYTGGKNERTQEVNQGVGG
jgi:hypothetical protein